MHPYVDPNGTVDAPVKKQIIMVLLGFVVMTAVIATAVHFAMK